MRYLVVIAVGGRIRGAQPVKDLGPAKAFADMVAEDLNPETDDCVVLDTKIDVSDEQRVYQPLRK